ncbi:MAG: hypothetical protein IPM26_11205 [Saprospiraceae bacterium]|nr:hypothetical protein [Saprospiraceae bacterium]
MPLLILKFLEMKNLLLLVLPFVLFSCKSGVEAHKAAIEELGTNWDAATTAVTGFAEALTAEVNSFNAVKEATMLTEDAQKMLKGDAAAKYTEAVNAFNTATAGYGAIQTELNDFVTMWTEKAAAVTALKDGLAAGKIEGDVNAQITELSGLVTKANESLAAWQAKQAEVKAASEAAAETLKAAYEMVKPKK